MLNDRLNRTPITGTTRAAIFAALLTMTVAVAAAQSAYFSFSGSVVDESGRGVPGTTLVLANGERRMKYEVQTNESGRFEFVGLPAGEYGLLVRSIGFQDLKDAVAISGRNLQRNITLKLGTLQETITVSFNPADPGGDSRSPQPAAQVKEVPMPAPKECAASASGGQILAPRKIRNMNPVYPAALRGTGTGGTVLMEGRIGLDGYVGDIRIIGDAHPELAQAAIAAVREWRYTQTLLNCQPVEVTMTITTNFKEMPPPPPPAPRP